MKKIAVRKPILVGLTVLLVVAGVIAGPSIRKTKGTFSDSVRVPGATLSAGTYYFSAPLPNSRSIVRITDENGRYMTQFMGLLDYPRKPVRDIITFGDHDCGPKAIKAWSYPPSGSAVRLVYSQDEAASIAAACNEPVPETHERRLTNQIYRLIEFA